MVYKKLSYLILITLILIDQLSQANNSSTNCSNCPISKNTALYRAFCAYSLHDLLEENLILVKKNYFDDHQIFLTAIPEYMHSTNLSPFQSCSFGSLPFWSGDNTLTIGNNDGAAQLDAYQLGLGTVITNSDGIAGKIQLCPQVTHVGSDFIFHYIDHADKSGFFIKIHAPLVAMIVKGGLKELQIAQPDNALTTTVPGGTYINQFYPGPARRYPSISQAFYGGINQENRIDGNISKPIRLRHGRIIADTKTEIRLSDLVGIIGGRILFDPNKSFSFGMKVTCPTGNLPTCEYMLEPIIGRGGAWAIGGDFAGTFQFVNNKKKSHMTTINFHSEVLHLIPGRRINLRSFDLKKNGPGSKYLLIEEYPAAYLANASPIPPSPVYTEMRAPLNIQPAVNLTTLPVISNIACEGSFALLIDSIHGNWSIGLGAEVWGRTQEHLSFDIESIVDLRMPKLDDYAVVGRQVGSYLINGQPAYYANLCEPLATIHTSQDPVDLTGVIPDVIPATPLPAGIENATIAENRIPANLADALDICGAQASKVLSIKAFGKIGYIWKERVHAPSLQLFGGIELATNNSVPQLWSIGCVGTVRF